MRLEPTTEAPTSPNSGDVYFDDTLNSLMVYNGTGWFKSESALLKSVNSEEMYRKSGIFLGVNRQKAGNYLTGNRWKMMSFDNAISRVCQFNFIMPDTYIARRPFRINLKWTLSDFVFSNVSAVMQIGVTKGPYNNGDSSMEYFNAFLLLNAFQIYNLPDNVYVTPNYSGVGMSPGTPISVAIFRNIADTYNGIIYVSNVEVEMV